MVNVDAMDGIVWYMWVVASQIFKRSSPLHPSAARHYAVGRGRARQEHLDREEAAKQVSVPAQMWPVLVQMWVSKEPPATPQAHIHSCTHTQARTVPAP